MKKNELCGIKILSHATRLDRASSYFFLIGFFVSKIQHVPTIVFSSLFNLVSLVMYLIGYLLWFVASLLYPNHPKINEEWYGFAQFKEQFRVAALTGLIATILSVCAFFVPYMLIPAAWLFLASNVLWCIGEYHKLNNPSDQDENYSYSQQRAYVSYTATMTIISVLSALATTLMILFPLIAMPVIASAGVIGIGLGTLAFEFLLDYKFGNHPKTSIHASYDHMTQSLGHDTSALAEYPVPFHAASVFMPQNTEHLELIPPSDELTCKSSL